MNGNFAFKKFDWKGERGKELLEENTVSGFIFVFVCALGSRARSKFHCDGEEAAEWEKLAGVDGSAASPPVMGGEAHGAGWEDRPGCEEGRTRGEHRPSGAVGDFI